MENTGQIEIIIKGRKGNFDLRPDNYDIKEVIELLKHAENLLFPNVRQERPTISYQIEAGSVKHVIKTNLQAIIGFNAILAQIKADNYSIDFLESPTARAFEYFQQVAQKNNYEYEIKTSVSNESSIHINKETKFIRSEDIWVNAEFYFYGIITDMGGKGQANVHLDTKEYGLIKFQASKTLLENYENNPLYKSYGIRATGKQNVRSGDIDRNSLHLVNIIDYNPSSQGEYIRSLIQKAKKSWADISDADEWLQEIRGYGT